MNVLFKLLIFKFNFFNIIVYLSSVSQIIKIGYLFIIIEGLSRLKPDQSKYNLHPNISKFEIITI